MHGGSGRCAGNRELIRTGDIAWIADGRDGFIVPNMKDPPGVALQAGLSVSNLDVLPVTQGHTGCYANRFRYCPCCSLDCSVSLIPATSSAVDSGSYPDFSISQMQGMQTGSPKKINLI